SRGRGRGGGDRGAAHGLRRPRDRSAGPRRGGGGADGGRQGGPDRRGSGRPHGARPVHRARLGDPGADRGAGRPPAPDPGLLRARALQPSRSGAKPSPRRAAAVIVTVAVWLTLLVWPAATRASERDFVETLDDGGALANAAESRLGASLRLAVPLFAAPIAE